MVRTCLYYMEQVSHISLNGDEDHRDDKVGLE
jgi:hypothetical protein